MKFTIALSGKSNTGKTSTINELISRFSAEGGQTDTQRTSAKSKNGNKPKDCVCFVSYKGKTIMFVTVGDYLETIEDLYNTYGKECDLYVGACRTKGETREFYLKNAKHLIIARATIETSEKSQAKFEERSNQNQVNDIFDLITTILKI